MMLPNNWNKYLSLEYLRQQGLNTPDFELCSTPDELLDRLRYLYIVVEEKRTSVRCFKEGNSFNEPFFPNYLINLNNFGAWIKLLKEGYKIIVSKPIDPVGAIIKGNIMLFESFSMRRFDYIVEYTEGTGTVRDLENEKKVIKLHNELPYPIKTKQVYHDSFKLFKKIEEPIIVEWSIYDRPIGMKEEEVIYWEIRKGYSPLGI